MVALREEEVDVGLSVLVFVTVAGVTEKAVVTEAFQVAVFAVYANKCLFECLYG